MIQLKKGQASFEFLSTYVWVLMAVTVTIGSLFYFNVFSPEKYLPEDCTFGQNIVCDTWNVIYDNTNKDFDINILLENNLEKPIKTTDASITDRDDVAITCPAADTKLYCPFDGTLINWTANNPTAFEGEWKVGMSCKLEMKNCDKALISGSKDTFRVSLSFKRSATGSPPEHIIKGRVFSTVQ